jgi:U1 small nuclear ribonucleoprotein
VARLSYEATEQDLESEFGRFGPIERVRYQYYDTCWTPANIFGSQIRIVTDTHQDEKPNKKKKKHRGYAFVVYEREKDMRGNPTTTPMPTTLLAESLDILLFVKIWPSSCLSSFLHCLLPSPRYTKYGQHD